MTRSWGPFVAVIRTPDGNRVAFALRGILTLNPHAFLALTAGILLSGCGNPDPGPVARLALTPVPAVTPAPSPAPTTPSVPEPVGQAWTGKTHSGKAYRFLVPEGWRIDSPRAVGADFYGPDGILYFGTRNDEPLGWTGLGYKAVGQETIRTAAGLTFVVTYTEPNREAWAKLGYKGYDDNPNALPVVATGSDAAGAFEIRVIYSYDTVKAPDGKARLPELLERIRVP